jgi:FkbM family methyltransferase
VNTPVSRRVAGSVARTAKSRHPLIVHLNKPFYLVRPGQLARRLAPARRAPPDAFVTTKLPWGADITVFPRETVGSSIWRTGVFELPVSETIARLLDPGEVAVDAGANIGYMSCLMASRVGREGRVIAYEPHPGLCGVLTSNARRWRAQRSWGEVSVQELALSDCSGLRALTMTDEFSSNMGTATLESLESSSGEMCIQVRAATLDEELAERSIGLLKLDVEGHELAVLEGARRLLRRGAIRDLIFEEEAALPTPVSKLLESSGFTLFGLQQRILGPHLVAATSERARPLWDAPTYLATRCPARAVERMRPRGWLLFRGRAQRARDASSIRLQRRSG